MARRHEGLMDKDGEKARVAGSLGWLSWHCLWLPVSAVPQNEYCFRP